MPKEYFITAPRYIRQAGQAEPEMVYASPNHPAKIVLDDDVPVPENHPTIHATEPGKPKPHFVEKKSAHAPRATDTPAPSASVSVTPGSGKKRLSDQ